jgi:hypothetical protein
VTAAEAARLQADPICREKDWNPEKRFVLVPQTDKQSSNSENEYTRPKDATRKGTSKNIQSESRGEEQSTSRHTLGRQRSRQDLPSLETKAPRDIPPQYRRSNSAHASTPNDYDETPKATARTPRTPSGEYFLSPDVVRKKDYFGTSAPRAQGSESSGGRAAQNTDGRPLSRSGTPTSEKGSPGFEGRSSIEKLMRPKQLSEEHAAQRLERPTSNHSDRPSTGHSSHSNHSHPSRNYYSSSEDDVTGSDSDRKHRYSSRDPRRKKSFHPNDDYDRHLRSPSRSNRSSGRTSTGKLNSPLVSPKVSPSYLPSGNANFDRSETFPTTNKRASQPMSPYPTNQETPRASKLNPLDPPSQQRHQSRSDVPPIPPKHQTPYPTEDPSMPIPIPIPVPSRIDLHSPNETRRTPSIPQYREPRSPGPTNTQPAWQPPPFQPPTNLEKPVGAYRRASEDIESGSIPPLPTCPRKELTRGRNDWLTLPGYPEFDICPHCFNSSIARTEFRHLFVPAASRPPDALIRCDFGHSPWYRIAWLLTLK